MKEERREEKKKRETRRKESKNESLLPFPPFIFVEQPTISFEAFSRHNPPFLVGGRCYVDWLELKDAYAYFFPPPMTRSKHDPSPLRRPGAIRSRRRTQPLNAVSRVVPPLTSLRFWLTNNNIDPFRAILSGFSIPFNARSFGGGGWTEYK